MFYSVLAQVSPETIKQVTDGADFLQGKDAKWWFAVLFILFIGTGMLIVWWLLKYHTANMQQMSTQLEQQRFSNTELNKSLIEYISEDHVKTTMLLSQVGDTLRQVGETMIRISTKLEAHS